MKLEFLSPISLVGSGGFKRFKRGDIGELDEKTAKNLINAEVAKEFVDIGAPKKKKPEPKLIEEPIVEENQGEVEHDAVPTE